VRRTDRGSVTAETAVVLPLLAAVTVALVWVVSLAATQVRVVDAARETARAAARDESRTRAIELGRRVAPPSSRITVQDLGESVAVDVVAVVRGPGGVLRFLPSVQLSSHAVAAKELP
jgi:Flp pilus assembly protein TadG